MLPPSTLALMACSSFADSAAEKTQREMRGVESCVWFRFRVFGEGFPGEFGFDLFDAWQVLGERFGQVF